MKKVFLLLVLFAIGGCGPKTDFTQKHDFSTGEWSYEEKVDFVFPVDDTEGQKDLWIEIDHSEDYSYQNLYAKLTTEDPSGNTASQLLSFELAHKSGQWFGRCFSGDCHIKILIKEKVRFEEKGTYKMGLEQFTRKVNLEGIESIRFKVTQSL